MAIRRYTPRHQAQLGRGVRVAGRTRGSRDCGPRTWQMGVDAQTRGARVPGVILMRRRALVTGPQPTSVLDSRRAVNGLRSRGRRPMRFYVLRDLSRVRQAVRKGRPVQAGIDYGAFADELRGRVGDPAYRGGHSILIYGQRRRRGVVQWQILDPLDDERRRGIPQGPRWVPRRAVVRGLVALARGRRDFVHAGVFAGARRRDAA